MRAIISRGLYIFYPIFRNDFFVFKEAFSENSFLMDGLYSRAACNQERLMMARIRYILYNNKRSLGNDGRFISTRITWQFWDLQGYVYAGCKHFCRAFCRFFLVSLISVDIKSNCSSWTSSTCKKYIPSYDLTLKKSSCWWLRITMIYVHATITKAVSK